MEFATAQEKAGQNQISLGEDGFVISEKDLKLGDDYAMEGYTVKAYYKLMEVTTDKNNNQILVDLELAENVFFTPVPVTDSIPDLKVPMSAVANKTLKLAIQIVVEPK